jgi:predicted HicB family RNase H-like nuclease
LNEYLEYKGFKGTVAYSKEDDLLYGKVVGLPNVSIMYDGKCLKTLKKDFMEAVDFYLLPDKEEHEAYLVPQAV